MTSRSSFWNLSLMNMKKRIPFFAISFFMCFFAMPVVTFFVVREGAYNYVLDPGYFNVQQFVRNLMGQIAEGQGVQIVVTVIMAFLFAITGSSWNNIQKKNDFYKALPVKESTRFVYIHLNSLIFYVICFGINLIFCNVAIMMFGFYRKLFLVATAYSLLIHTLCFIAVYFTVLVAELLTGNSILAICLAVGMIFYEPLSRTLISGYKSSFFKTFYMLSDGRMSDLRDSIISPIAGYYDAYKSIAEKYMDFYFVENYADILPGVIKLTVLSVVLIALSFYVYMRRPAEAVNNNIVFTATKPYIKCLVMIPVVLWSGLFFYSMGQEEKGLAVFGIISGILVLHVALQFILEGYFGALKKGFVTTAISGVIVCIVFSFFVLRAHSYDVYVPDREDITSMSFVGGGEHRYNFYKDRIAGYYSNSADIILEELELTDDETVNMITGAIQAGIADNKYTWDADWSNGEMNSWVAVKYNIGNKEVYRSYVLPADVVKNIRFALYDNPAYKTMVNQLEYEGNKKFVADVDSLNIVYNNLALSYYDKCEIKDASVKQKILDALREDHNNRTSNDYQTMFPIGNVNISMIDDYDYMYRYIDMPVYSVDTNTLAVLKSVGYEPKRISGDMIETVVIDRYVEGGQAETYDAEVALSTIAASKFAVREGEYRNLTVKFGKESPLFKYTLDNCVISDAANYSPFEEYMVNYDYTITFYLESGQTRCAYFVKDIDMSRVDEQMTDAEY